MQVEFFQLNNSHAAAIAELESEAFSVPWSLNQILSELSGTFSVCVGVRIADKTIGYCFARALGTETEILRVAVLRAEQNRGVGEQLMRYVLTAAYAPEFYLECREGNAKARRLYERLGFVSGGVRKNYYESPTESGIIYKLSI
ncbi:MAG: ribosomal protein S18-alanine N-acetyltransferase [Oscillospiraceae bacterium]|nr:ribosomal protein S18-alanine N-acetyltransferase [Oscillospiraceae bacterium]